MISWESKEHPSQLLLHAMLRDNGQIFMISTNHTMNGPTLRINVKMKKSQKTTSFIIPRLIQRNNKKLKVFVLLSSPNFFSSTFDIKHSFAKMVFRNTFNSNFTQMLFATIHAKDKLKQTIVTIQ